MSEQSATPGAKTSSEASLPFSGEASGPPGLPALSRAYTDMQMALGMERLERGHLRERVSVLMHDNEVLRADRDHWRSEAGKISDAGLERHEKWKAAERKLEELRSYLHQFASTHGATKEIARSWLLAEAKAYQLQLAAEDRAFAPF